MQALVSSDVANNATSLQIQLKEWFTCHSTDIEVRKSYVLVKTKWESQYENSHLELPKPERQEKYLILSHDDIFDPK